MNRHECIILEIEKKVQIQKFYKIVKYHPELCYVLELSHFKTTVTLNTYLVCNVICIYYIL